MAALVGGACSDATAPSKAKVEEILFLSTRDNGNLSALYRMQANGTGVERLGGQGLIASWHQISLSRDRTKLAFANSTIGGISVMNTDGTGQPQHVGTGFNASPRWSRDGKRIAFLSNRDGRVLGTTHGLYDVWVMNSDGTNERNVSKGLGDQMGFNVEVCSWSADGRIVFQTSGLGTDFLKRRTYIVNADGTGLKPLFTRLYDSSPFWSPDGSKLAFTSDRDGRRRLYVMNADGSGEKPLTPTGLWDDHLPIWMPGFGFSYSYEYVAEYDPWSPDGTRIAFERWGDAFGEEIVLYVINVDGSGLRQLSNSGQFNGWSPIGQRLAFTRWTPWTYPAPAGIPDVFVINADGTGLQNVTNHASHDAHAMWVLRR